jgi:diaminopimelate decarboxylase
MLGGVRLDAIASKMGVSTPFYAYDLDAVAAETRALVDALGPRGLCAYAIKANAADPIVRAIAAEGAGIDVVSAGELRLALSVGVAPARIVYSGVAKRDDELDLAVAESIKAIHVESVEEIDRLAARAKAENRSAVAIAIRLNPGVEADTHAHIATGHDDAKFGVALDDLPRALESIAASEDRVRLVGLSVHVGSQLMTVDPYLAGVDAVCDVAQSIRARAPHLAYLDTGGGFGVPYREEEVATSPAEIVVAAQSRIREHGLGDLAHVVEPGRALVAAHGVLVSTVVQPKRSRDRRWLLIDAGMNDLIRPALYQAHHRIVPMRVAPGDDRSAWKEWRVAGPVCESSDDFGAHLLPDPAPDAVVIHEAGAYGRSMASGYNLREVGAEVFVSNGTASH